MSVSRVLIQDIDSGLYLTDDLRLVPREKSMAFKREAAYHYRHRKYGDDWEGRVVFVEADPKDKSRTVRILGGRKVTQLKKNHLRNIARLPRTRSLSVDVINMFYMMMVRGPDQATTKEMVKIIDKYKPSLLRDYWDPNLLVPTPSIISAQDKIKDLIEWVDQQKKEKVNQI